MMKKMILALMGALTCMVSPLEAKEGEVQCGNLIYAGSKTSRCFSDEFLSTIQQRTSINTSRRFRSVRMDNDELFRFPFVVMTGEGNFNLTAREKENLKKYVESGGFLLASAGCSDKTWDKAFRREMASVFGNDALQSVPMDHAVFSTIFNITSLMAGKRPSKNLLQGISYEGKLVIMYSADGLNDSTNSRNCCCCGGSELSNAREINANILSYALLR